MDKVVKKGDQVAINYVGKLADGNIFDTTEGRDVFRFEAGSQNIIPGVSNGVIGMKVGEKKLVEIEPKDAYGEYNPELVAKAPRTNIPEEVKVGDVLTDSSTQQHWWVRQLTDEYAILDANHPLAGKKLIFDIELVEVA